MLNTVSSTLTVCVAAGATKKDRAACNKLLEEEHHQWRLKETKSTFEKKPAGNECRHFLWKPGDVLLKLMRARYGVTSANTTPLENEVRAAQAEGAHHCPDAQTRINATPREQPAVQAKRPRNRGNVSVAAAVETAKATNKARPEAKPAIAVTCTSACPFAPSPACVRCHRCG